MLDLIISACENDNKDKASIKRINNFPNHLNRNGNTSLLVACENKLMTSH